MGKKQKMYWLKNVPIAHRGLHNISDVPENSLAACVRAIENGYGIEVDVRFSRDGVAAIFHDRKLDRLTSGHGSLRARDYAEISLFTIGQSREKIPQLSDVLSLAAGKVPLMIELKSSFFHVQRDARMLAKMMEDYDGNYALISFDPGANAWWRRHDSSINVGQIFHDQSALRRISCIVLWLLYGQPGQFFAVPVSGISRKFFCYLRSSKGPMLTWTVRTSEEHEHAQKYADNIIFEETDSFSLKK